MKKKLMIVMGAVGALAIGLFAVAAVGAQEADDVTRPFNSLASRVTDNVVQIIDVYRKIIWNTSNLSSGLIGDGTGNPEKSNDFGLLEQFIRTSDKGPGLYMSGDNIAQEWVGLAGPGAQNLKDLWIPFSLLDGDHKNHGESVSPTLTASGASFIHAAVPDQLVAYGGCALVNDFDVIQPVAN